MKRIFTAFEISDAIRSAVAVYSKKLRREFGDLRVEWEDPEKMHITLRFFGNVDEKQLQAIIDSAKAATGTFGPFCATSSSTGCFSRRGSPGVLWLGVDDIRGEISSIRERFEKSLSANGFERERRKYTPHLTIARLRDPKRSSRLVDAHLSHVFEPFSFEIDALAIIESVLKPKGSEYSPVTKIHLPVR